MALSTIMHPKRIRGFVAFVVFGIIILVFAFWGLTPSQQGQNQMGAGFVAQVNGEMITTAEFREAVEAEQQRYAPFMGGAQIDAQRNFFQQQALRGLVQQAVLNQQASKEGIQVADEAVLNFIVKEIPIFQQNGRFQRDRYMAFLQNRNMTATEFEKSIRKQMVFMNLQKAFAGAVSTSPEEQKRESLADSVKMNVAFVELQKDQLVQGKSVSDSEAIQFLSADPGKTSAESYFKDNTIEFSSPERTRAQHILIAFKKGDSASEKSAYDKILDIQKQVSTDEFGKIAAKVSEDPGSKSKQGDLGYFERGKMVPEFDQAAFTLPIGKVSEPIKTDYGYHLIKVTDRKAAESKKFDDVKMQIAKKLIGERKFQDLVDSLNKELAKGNLDGLESYLKANSLNWQETGLFEISSESIPKLNNNDKISEAVFKLSTNNRVSSELVRSADKYFAFKLKELKKAEPTKTSQSLMENEGRQAGELMQSWFEAVEKTAKVETNQQFFQE